MERKPSVSTKPWAVYHDRTPIGIGLVVGETRDNVDILYSERQTFPAECWDSKYVKRFDTYQEAIRCYLEVGEGTREKLESLVKRDFPTAIELTQPKCTERMLHDGLARIENPRMQELRECAEAGVRAARADPNMPTKLVRLHYQAAKYARGKEIAQADTAANDFTRFHG